MYRRQFIFSSASAAGLIFTGGCVSRNSINCSEDVNELNRSICRQSSILDSAPMYMTAGAVVGAALGASIALALHGNPIVGALSGALIGGGAVAVDRYLTWCREQASGDEKQLPGIISSHISGDVRYSTAALQDSVVAIREAIEAIENKNQQLLANAANLKKTDSLIRIVKANRKTFKSVVPLYQGALERVSEARTEQNQIGIKTISTNARKIEDDEIRYFAMVNEAT